MTRSVTRPRTVAPATDIAAYTTEPVTAAENGTGCREMKRQSTFTPRRSRLRPAPSDCALTRLLPLRSVPAARPGTGRGGIRLYRRHHDPSGGNMALFKRATALVDEARALPGRNEP